jgi:hypothetical protein
MADIEALWLTLKETEEAAKKQLWDQSYWMAEMKCGTTGCFAGHYAISQGCVPALDSHFYDDKTSINDTADCFTPEGERVYIRSFAKEGLGLTEDEADALFEGDNTLSDLRLIIEAISKGESVRFWNRRDH